jgi:hypothetical protein
MITCFVISVLPLAEFHPTRKAKRAPAHGFRRASPSSPNLEPSRPFIVPSGPHFNSPVFNCLPTLAEQGFHSTLFLSTACALLRRNRAGSMGISSEGSFPLSFLATHHPARVCPEPGREGTNSFPCHTSKIITCNSFACRTCKNKGLINPVFATHPNKQGVPPQIVNQLSSLLFPVHDSLLHSGILCL